VISLNPKTEKNQFTYVVTAS